MKSYVAKDPGTNREWVLVDARDKVLGKLAVCLADLLRGRNRPTFTRQVDTGGFVVVVNAAKVKLSGRKEEQKLYQRYSGWPDGLKRIPASVMRKEHPDRMIRIAVKGMLPRNNMSRILLQRLKVYAGETHPHAAQKPKPIAAA